MVFAHYKTDRRGRKDQTQNGIRRGKTASAVAFDIVNHHTARLQSFLQIAINARINRYSASRLRSRGSGDEVHLIRAPLEGDEILRYHITRQAANMFSALIFLVLLIAAAPVTLIWDGPIVYGLVMAMAAISVVVLALRIHPGEAGFLLTVIRPVAYLAPIPVIWMLIQMLPTQVVGIAHPIWTSAAAALEKPLAGSISIDPGATLISLARYLAALAIALVAAALAIDRRRAAWILFALAAAATLAASISLVAKLCSFFELASCGNWRLTTQAATDCAALGVMLTIAAAFYMLDRRKAKQLDQVASAVWLWPNFAACIVALALCILAVLVGATEQAYFAVACGVATFGVAVGIRGLRLGSWGISAVVAAILFFGIAIILLHQSNQNLVLAFASHARGPLISVTQRVLADANWVGTGAGTFSAILPIYGASPEVATTAPNAAALIIVEMGRPFFLGILIAAIALVAMLLRGGWQRQRDSFYSTAGASCIVTIVLLGFGNADLFYTPALIIFAATIGVAIAQSKSRLN